MSTERLTYEEATARLQLALLPGGRFDGEEFQQRALHAFERYGQFCRDILAEAGPEVLTEIVTIVERHCRITQT